MRAPGDRRGRPGPIGRGRLSGLRQRAHVVSPFDSSASAAPDGSEARARRRAAPDPEAEKKDQGEDGAGADDRNAPRRRPSRGASARRAALDGVLQAYKATDLAEAEAARTQAEEAGAVARQMIEEFRRNALPGDPDIYMDLRQSLQGFLIEFHWLILFAERFAFQGPPERRAPLIEVVNRAKRDFNAFLGEFESRYVGPISIKLVKMGPTPVR
jgi:hypothetical protein